MRKVYVIAGHSGPGTGANGYIDEGAETIVLRDLIVAQLRVMGIQPEIDINNDKLSNVVSWIKRLVSKKDIVIDIHFNASTNKAATGVECLVSAEGEIEKPMAREMCSSIATTLGIKNRGVKSESSGAHSTLAMLSKFEAEQLILEVCFVSNRQDALAYNANKYKVAYDIASVLHKYAKA